MSMFNYYLSQFATPFLRKQVTKKKSWLSTDDIPTTPEQNGRRHFSNPWAFFTSSFRYQWQTNAIEMSELLIRFLKIT